MKKQLLFTGLLSLGLFANSTMAQKSNNYLLVSARIDGAQQVPANASTALGVGGFMLNPTRDTMCVNVSVNNLSGPITAAHIHEGMVGVNGVAIVDLTPFIKGNRIVGSITGSALTKDLVMKMSTAMNYINIHTGANPNGEIRGQLGLESDWGFTAKLDGAQQNPAVATSAFGLAVFKLSKDRTKLKVNFVGHNLSGKIEGAHLHKGGIGQNGDVIADLMQVGVANNFSIELDPTAYLADLLAGNVYINVHTAAKPSGEIRGQLKLETDLVFDAKLNGAEQNPALSISAIGLGSVTIDHAMSSLSYEVVATGLSGAITSAHLHIGAKGFNGSVAVALTGINGNKISGTVTGTNLTPSLMAKIFAGEVYINVHTAKNQGGEIRGQLNRYLRNGYSLSLDGMSQVPATASAATGAGIVSIDSDNKDLHYMVVVSGLKSKLDGAHFHHGTSVQTGGVIYDLTSLFFKTGINDAAFGYLKGSAFKSDDARKFSKDSVYINLHNADFPGGEIRGQVMNGAPCFNLPKSEVGVEEKNSVFSSLEIAPNPTTGVVDLTFQSTLAGNAVISVSDLMGKELLTEKININSNTNSYRLNMSEMISGVYVVKVQIGANNIVKRVIRN